MGINPKMGAFGKVFRGRKSGDKATSGLAQETRAVLTQQAESHGRVNSKAQKRELGKVKGDIVLYHQLHIQSFIGKACFQILRISFINLHF